jgi:hypothetical protein
MNELKIYQNKYIKKVRELEAQIVIIDHTKEVTDITQASQDEVEASFKLAKRFQLTEAQARFIMSISMRDLTRKGKDDLINEKERTHEHLIEMQRKFKYIDQSIYDEVESLQKKYSKSCPRKCKFPNFIGAVKIMGNGFVQFETMKDVDAFMTKFDAKDVDVILYPSGPNNKFIVRGNSVTDETDLDHPKEFVADDFVITRFKPKFTICEVEDTLSRLPGVCAGTKDVRATFVGDNFIQITNAGKVLKRASSEISLRKSMGAKGARHDVMYISDIVAPEVVVVYCNSREKNLIRVSRVTVDSGGILKIPIGKTKILGVYRIDCEFAISVPDEYLNRCVIRHVVMTGDQVNPNTNVKIDLNKKSLDDGRKLVKENRSHIYRIG